MFSQISSHMLCYYLYCTTVYHDLFDINNIRHKLPAEDWRVFVQSDVGSHSHMHCTVHGGPVLLRSMETQAAKVFTTFSPRLTSGALLHTRSLATLPTIFPKSSQGSETTCSTLWSYLHPIVSLKCSCWKVEGYRYLFQATVVNIH